MHTFQLVSHLSPNNESKRWVNSDLTTISTLKQKKNTGFEVMFLKNPENYWPRQKNYYRLTSFRNIK